MNWEVLQLLSRDVEVNSCFVNLVDSCGMGKMIQMGDFFRPTRNGPLSYHFSLAHGHDAIVGTLDSKIMRLG